MVGIETCHETMAECAHHERTLTQTEDPDDKPIQVVPCREMK
jgi:hypothetical protein